MNILRLIRLIFVLSILLGCGESMDKESSPDKKSDYSQVQEFKKLVVDKYRGFKPFMGKEGARKRTVEWVLEQEEVKSAGISEDGETIWILLKNGVEVDVITK